MRTSLIALLAVVSTGSALAQDAYTYEMRLVPDGVSGSAGPTPATTFNFNVGATRIGFWLQARVAQSTGQNWGIARISSPSAGEASFIALTDPASASSLSRGVVNTGGTAFGRATPYRNGGVASGNTGNAPGATPFPGSAGNENGTLDNGGSGFIARRIYGFDAYLGSTRADTDADGDGDVDDNGDGLPENPWRVNGGTTNAAVDGVPHPSDGTFAPWANVYRFYLDVSNWANVRVITINASALINGAVQAAPTSPGGSSFALQLAPGQLETASFQFTTPTPGAAGLLGIAGLAGLRRRR